MASIRCLPVVLILFAGRTDAADEKPNDADRPAVKLSRSGRWLVQETANFHIYCLPSLPEAQRLPVTCESLRRQLQETWFGMASGDWSPKCDIVVFPTVSEYSRTLGPGSEQSSGCTSLSIEHERVVMRRIDLRGDADDWERAALPHELTHVIVADRFTKRQIPRWADEGMAILAEPVAKQTRRSAEMQRALAGKRLLTAKELLAISQYPPGNRRDSFLGQSASLVAFLLEQGSPETFLEFVERSATHDFDRALADVYGIASCNRFEVAWQAQMYSRGDTVEMLASRVESVISGQRRD